jgi:hypothetical protein
MSANAPSRNLWRRSFLMGIATVVVADMSTTEVHPPPPPAVGSAFTAWFQSAFAKLKTKLLLTAANSC